MLSEWLCKEVYKYQTDKYKKYERPDGMHEIRVGMAVRVKVIPSLILL